MGFKRTENKSVTPTVTAGAYSIGDVIGGLLTFDLTEPDSGLAVTRLLVRDANNQKKGIKAYIFRDQPTAIADNDAFAMSAADFAKWIGSIELEAADYTTIGAVAVGEKGEQAVSGVAVDGNLYVYLVAVEAITLATTSDIQATLTTWKD